MQIREAEVKQVQQELKYFKLELLNREENFNKMFGRSPTVGVMQVVKSKAGNTGSPSPSLPAGSSVAATNHRRNSMDVVTGGKGVSVPVGAGAMGGSGFPPLGAKPTNSLNGSGNGSGGSGNGSGSGRPKSGKKR